MTATLSGIYVLFIRKIGPFFAFPPLIICLIVRSFPGHFGLEAYQSILQRVPILSDSVRFGRFPRTLSEVDGVIQEKNILRFFSLLLSEALQEFVKIYYFIVFH